VKAHTSFLFVPLSQEEGGSLRWQGFEPQTQLVFGPKKELAQFGACLCLGPALAVCKAAKADGGGGRVTIRSISACRFSPVVFESRSTLRACK
jgi:hypothetical protein